MCSASLVKLVEYFTMINNPAVTTLIFINNTTADFSQGYSYNKTTN